MAAENEGGEVVQDASGEDLVTQSAEVTFDRPALESKVSEGLAALFGDESEKDTAADETEKPSAEEESAEDTVKEDVEEDTVKEDGDDKTDEQEEEAAAAPVTKTGNAPTLPDAYRRSLKAYGWEDADIDNNLKALGGSFVVTAQKIHANRNSEIATWADAGRRAREANKATDSPQQPQKFEAMKPIDTTALKEHFGDDKLINAIIDPVNAAIARINAMVPAIQQTQQKSQVAEMETLGRQVEGFFSSDKVKPYTEVYGTATKTLTPEQVVERNKVLETADALMCGAQVQGRTLSLDEALTLALDSVSGGYKAKAARQEITNALKKREKGITLKPGNKSKDAASGGPPAKTRGDLEKRVGTRLKAMFS